MQREVFVFITAAPDRADWNTMASPVVAAGVLGSRQKNCNSCVQTKRRCDRRTPVCSRCEERKVPCVYGKARPSNHTGHQETRPSPQTETFDLGSPVDFLFDSVAPFEVRSLDSLPVGSLPDAPDITSHPEPSAFVNQEISMDSFMDIVGIENTSVSERWLVPVDENLAVERPGTPADEEITNSYQKMAPFCVSPALILLHMGNIDD